MACACSAPPRCAGPASRPRSWSGAPDAPPRRVDRRVALYRGCRRAIPLAGRTVVLVDDGLATGATALAALRAVRHRHPRTVVLAAPVGARATVEPLARDVDHVVCLATPERFPAVAEYYDDFDQTSDADVIRLLLDRERERRGLQGAAR